MSRDYSSILFCFCCCFVDVLCVLIICFYLFVFSYVVSVGRFIGDRDGNKFLILLHVRRRFEYKQNKFADLKFVLIISKPSIQFCCLVVASIVNFPVSD